MRDEGDTLSQISRIRVVRFYSHLEAPHFRFVSVPFSRRSGGPGYAGKDTCISFDAINAAFDKAVQMYGLRPKLHDVDAQDVGRLGMALTFVAEYIGRM